MSSGPPESDSSPLTCVLAEDLRLASFTVLFALIEIAYLGVGVGGPR